MAKKKKPKINKKLARRVPDYTIFLGIILIVVMIKFFANLSMQDMENSAFRDENNQAIIPVVTTADVKQAVAYAFDPEAIIAQQIERAVSYRTQSRIEPLLKNIQENIQYNRNKAAIWFYLAYAYEQIGSTENAVAIYEKLRTTYEDRHVVLYVFNAPRELGNKRVYSASLFAEAMLRQALLLKDEKLLKVLRKSPATYGEEGAEGLAYAILAAANLKNLDSPVSSFEMYFQTLNKE